MYLAEAEKEDKELTEAWKGEADSILVFVRFFFTLLLSTPRRQTEAFVEDWFILCYRRGLHYRELQESIP
jgi:hypothetical protein